MQVIEKIAGRLDPSSNGWRRESVFAGDADGCFPEDAIDGFTVYYEHEGGEWCATDCYLVEETVTFNQPVQRVAWVVNSVCHIDRRVFENGEHVETEGVECDYNDDVSALFFDSEDDALLAAKGLALLNMSNCFAPEGEVEVEVANESRKYPA